MQSVHQPRRGAPFEAGIHTPLASSSQIMQGMHVNHIFADELKQKLWRPCREARALGL
jgi:hypothetical protein